MKKEIKEEKYFTFILDSFDLYNKQNDPWLGDEVFCYSWYDTEQALENRLPNIVTYDLSHLSFDLCDLGYKITIGYEGRFLNLWPGCSTFNGKELRHSHNLLRILIGGGLDNDLGIERNKFYYDKTKSTSELCEEEKLSILLKKHRF